MLVGSFRQDSEVAALSDRLRGLGFRVRTVRVVTAGRGTWYQVLIGPYTVADEARQDEARVRQLPGYADARLVTR